MCLPPDGGPGRELVYPGVLRPNLVEYISYDLTDLLQAQDDIVLACPAGLETHAAALRYVLRECGREEVFSLRPRVGEVLTLTRAFTKNTSLTVHLRIVRANQRAPLLADDFLQGMGKLVQWPSDRESPTVFSLFWKQSVQCTRWPIYIIYSWTCLRGPTFKWSCIIGCMSPYSPSKRHEANAVKQRVA